MEPEPLKGPKIVLAAYDLVLKLYPTVKAFPKSQQYMLGRRIEDAALEILLGLVVANTARDKRRHLPVVDREIEKLRFLVRLAFDLKFISLKRYGQLAGRVDEIGRMLGGWIKWTAERGTRNTECGTKDEETK
ncbi:MAG: diversity-generating retroelement protein Avd [Lentisphaerae bacterium]|nr:diversity-generating retroelement protein Avd [Lentisphaerota bacterium]